MEYGVELSIKLDVIPGSSKIAIMNIVIEWFRFLFSYSFDLFCSNRMMPFEEHGNSKRRYTKLKRAHTRNAIVQQKEKISMRRRSTFI